MQNLITITLLASLAASLLVLVLGRSQNTARWMALLLSFVPLALATYALAGVMAPTTFDTGAHHGTYVFYETHTWIPSLGITATFGLDGLSAPMFFLTTLLVTLGILFAWDETKRPNQFYGMLLAINVAVLGVFVALDLFLFYVFWELTLIPMAFLIGIWGGERRRYAAIKFFVYTFTASLIMLLGFMFLYFQTPIVDGHHTFSFESVIAVLQGNAIGLVAQRVLFLALFIGFAVKFPVVPFHTWLPDAHVEAPTAGSVILAGVLLKLGSYGLIRIALPMAPLGASYWVPLMFVIAVLSMLYASVICLVQRDYKRMVAYSSIGSMGLVLLGIAASVKTGNPLGLVGANFMMLAHGFISPALFMLCGILAHNLGTRDIPLMGGLADKIPRTSFWMVTFSMAGLGLPGLAAFVAEFQVYAATWDAFGWLVFIALLYLIFSAAYYLWAAQRAFFGPFHERPEVDYHHVYDVKWFELSSLVILFLFTLAYGVWPRLLTEMLDAPVAAVLTAIRGA